AMQSGIFWGYAGLIEGIVSRLRAENGPARVIATGGLAPLFADELSLIEAVEENLTIEGLAIVFERNTGEADQ
ncbi:MAG: pantothenate kinase, partial [Sphingomonadales bacterium]